MNFININLKLDKFTFSFTLKRKFAIISDDSGIGKSLLIAQVAFYINANNVKNMISSGSVTFTPDVVNSNLDYDKVFFIDDEYPQFGKLKLNTSRGRFIIVSRKGLSNVNCSYLDFYRVKIDKNTNRFSLIRKYPDLSHWVTAKSYQCEDSKSGFMYFSIWTDNAVYPGAGYSSLKPTDACIIADGSAIGAVFESLYRQEQLFYLPESFEYLVLVNLCNYTLDDLLRQKPAKYITLEKWLDTLIKDKLNFEYSKKFLHPELASVKLIDGLDRDTPNWIRFFELQPYESIVKLTHISNVKQYIKRHCALQKLSCDKLDIFMHKNSDVILNYNSVELLQKYIDFVNEK